MFSGLAVYERSSSEGIAAAGARGGGGEILGKAGCDGIVYFFRTFALICQRGPYASIMTGRYVRSGMRNTVSGGSLRWISSVP